MFVWSTEIYENFNSGILQNRFVSLVIWDSASDKGYQLMGKVEKMEEEAMMNGYAPELETKMLRPQVEWKLIVRVEKV